MLDELLEAWRTNERINHFLLEGISDEGLACSLSKRGGRDVARQFAHLHNVRVWHLEKRTKDLATGLKVFPTKVSPSRMPAWRVTWPPTSSTASTAFFTRFWNTW